MSEIQLKVDLKRKATATTFNQAFDNLSEN